MHSSNAHLQMKRPYKSNMPGRIRNCRARLYLSKKEDASAVSGVSLDRSTTPPPLPFTINIKAVIVTPSPKEWYLTHKPSTQYVPLLVPGWAVSHSVGDTN